MPSRPPSARGKAQLFRSLAVDLRELASLPLGKKEELERWDEAAEKFREKLSSTYDGIYDQLPHELEHYLTDSDIRFKDPSYRARQNEFLAGLLKSLDEKA